jgi:hypothetical protein
MNASEAKKVVRRVSASGAHRGQRDGLRTASYRAEDVAFGGSSWNGPQVVREDVVALAHMMAEWGCENLVDTAWWNAPNVRLHGEGGAWAVHSYRSSENEVVFPANRDTLSVAIVAHEIAHYLTPDDPGHGEAWRAAYLALVREFMGAEYAESLLSAFEGLKRRRTFRIEISFDGGTTWTRYAGKAKDLDLHPGTTAYMRRGPRFTVTLRRPDLSAKLRMVEA